MLDIVTEDNLLKMRKPNTILLSMLCLLLVSCSKKYSKEVVTGETAVHLVALTVSDLEVSTDWYSNNLGFSLDSSMQFPDYGMDINMLKLGEFQLELIEFYDSVSLDKSLLPSAHSNVHGFIKIGFYTDSLPVIERSFAKAEVEIIAGPAELPALTSGKPWPSRFLLVKDPDGNYVQFFTGDESYTRQYNLQGPFALAPYLSMLSVQDYEQTINWYDRMGFELVESLEQPGNRRSVMSLGNFILEIGSFRDDRSLKQLGTPDDIKDKVTRMNKLAFKTANFDSLYVLLTRDTPPFFEVMEGNQRSFIVKDHEGNLIQLFEESNPF